MSTANNLLDSYKVFLKSYATKKQYEVKTYAELTIHPDQYYSENMVLGNLPAGVYELNIPYGALNRKTDIQIYPGQVSYFSFSGFHGYDFTPPSPPESFIP